MKRSLPILLLVALLAVLTAGCGGSSGPKSVPAGDVAVVGDKSISKSQFDALLAQAKKSFKAQKRTFPKAGSQEYKSLQDQAVQYLIQRAEFDQKGSALGVTVSDKQVGARLAQIKKQYFNGDDKKYRTQLKTQGLTEDQVRQDIKAQLLSEGIFKKITSDVKVSDADVKAYYDSHKSQYGQPESRDVRHILVNSKKLADTIYGQLKSGGNFASLAKKYSKDPGSAAQGGKLTISRGQTVAPFDAKAFSLKTGELSPPVKTQYGWHIIQAMSAVRKAKQTPFEKVKESIRQQQLQTKKNDAMSKWVDQTKKEFCKGKLSYGSAYKPLTDPCTAITATTGTATAATTLPAATTSSTVTATTSTGK
jgi:parvulin-like peptidyl-prolyl isomerase